jgi:hypothetical protein
MARNKIDKRSGVLYPSLGALSRWNELRKVGALDKKGGYSQKGRSFIQPTHLEQKSLVIHNKFLIHKRS